MITPVQSLGPDRANQSGVSWAAIFAGAAGAAALSMILLLLGTGLGFAASSPWPDQGASAKTLAISTIVWLLVTQILASGLGGYLAGRLRVKWASLHADEVYFRDTSHGFLAWAVATLVTAALIASSVGGAASSVAQAGGQAAGAAVAAGGASVAGAATSGQGENGYFVDKLLRSADPAQANQTDAQGATSRILNKALAGDGQMNADDRAYLAQFVAQRTSLSQQEAEQKVDQVYAEARKAAEDAKVAAQQAADKAAKVAAYTALWTFVALLCGAFFASLAALFGGRQRDRAVWLDEPYAGTDREAVSVR
ncbi:MULTISPECIES: hypothetical protein [unclassified Pseudomonas]|uniref:hypothetical protein n=1 Tax=unclassified Pseudomonas TaxID=196821 RepID=UPI000BD82E66|nr:MULTISPECIES: hypothetical protein [unclassified Pseudomonas]PVZ12485.1 hypothetical protein F474_03282 [Pseudomonas sp. URIL14HWK12:I12]PVZ23363.1 hypothetical protein F470_02920 [Pseudomonas sp. URIL14HWK12:I10]PVZ32693.1 hypothetical protein F472_03268 [Pseudomonas sp. URIL14HWK12:I11]SNZ13847.1 hypothetical protein SAMN05660463_02617 [Pseudomonas sp. URIL14HWK12:I9]